MIEINDKKYEIIESNWEIDEELLKVKITEYFESFDYILGDFAYGKLRLKGFNKKDNKNFKKINDFNNIKDYINKNCAYGCNYFILKVIENKK
ncbi:MAG: DUF1027 domain-containing protein [Firmicutes bacterium]|nr:DUF1027 domain-containing protein [Bacillota bacterium]